MDMAFLVKEAREFPERERPAAVFGGRELTSSRCD
jgi:hypothetical protein